MYSALERLSSEIIDSNKNRSKLYPKTQQRLDALGALYEMIKCFPTTPNERVARAEQLVYDCYKILGIAREKEEVV